MKFQNAEEKNDSWNASILEKLDEQNKYKLNPILEQVKATNGRVSSLERWRTWLVGGAFVFVPVFMAVSGWLITKQLNQDKEIQSAIDAKFQSYKSSE